MARAPRLPSAVSAAAVSSKTRAAACPLVDVSRLFWSAASNRASQFIAGAIRGSNWISSPTKQRHVSEQTHWNWREEATASDVLFFAL